MRKTGAVDTRVVTALEARHLTSGTVLKKPEAAALAKELGITPAQLKDAMAQLPKDYSKTMGQEPNATTAGVVSTSVFEVVEKGSHPALDALLDPSPKKREEALILLENGLNIAQQLAGFTGDPAYDYVGHPLDASMLMGL